ADLSGLSSLMILKPPCAPAGTAWSCPEVRITCAMANPRNDCYSDRHCPRSKKCCQTFCGRRGDVKEGMAFPADLISSCFPVRITVS
uniref:WAP domain-containing protein n=1 Tax=Coturnix japonica TaxID=93934 RepID=A0A8C2UCS5_COTJA